MVHYGSLRRFMDENSEPPSTELPMSQKFFISFNAADCDKAHWIAWTLKEAGHEVAVHDWEIPAGGSAPLWMNQKLAWADQLIAVISPDYATARFSLMEWAAQIWEDFDGAKGAVIPIIVRPTPNLPPLLRGLSRIDLTDCREDEARTRLLNGVERPTPPQRKPAFERVAGEPPDTLHPGPTEKPAFHVASTSVLKSIDSQLQRESNPRFGFSFVYPSAWDREDPINGDGNTYRHPNDSRIELRVWGHYAVTSPDLHSWVDQTIACLQSEEGFTLLTRVPAGGHLIDWEERAPGELIETRQQIEGCCIV